MSIRITRAAMYLGIALLVFSTFRLAILLTYPEDFDNLSANEILLSFITGFRVDLITILTFGSPLLLLMIFPNTLLNHKTLQSGFALLFYLFIVSCAAALYGDYLYFEHVQRHTSNEIFYLEGGDASVVVESLKQNWPGVLLLLVFFGLLLSLTLKIEHKFNYPLIFTIKNFAVFVIVFILMAVAIRGTLQGKPFGIINAFSSAKAESGHLALNGIYSVYRSSARDGKVAQFMDDGQALKITTALLQDDIFEFADENYPLQRQLTESKLNTPDFPQFKNANVVIFLLEGWSALYVDSFSNVGFKATPHFDALTQDGLKFTNFFSNGQRSIDGITALFTGIPRVAGINRLGSGLEVAHVSFLGDLAKQNGYQTLAMQSSKRSSFRLDSICQLAGFDTYYGAEDIPQLGLETSGLQPYFGTWDNNTFQFFLTQVNQMTAQSDTEQAQPFLAFVFSATTHTPFISPGKEWEIYPHDDDDMYGYLNTLYYADAALGRFMESAKQQSWYDNTVFIFMADHTVGFGQEEFLKDFKTPERELENMRIPLLVYAPALLQAGISEQSASQTDIMPSLVHLLSWKGSFSSVSNSLFTDSSRFSLLEQGPVITYVKQDAYLQHNLDKTLGSTFKTKTQEKELLAIYQVVTTLLKKNIFYKKGIAAVKDSQNP